MKSRSRPRPGNRRTSPKLLTHELREARQVAYMLKADLDRAATQRNGLGVIALVGWAVFVITVLR